MFASDKEPYAILSIQEHRTIGEIKALMSAVYYVLGKEEYTKLSKSADYFINLLENELP